MSVNDNELIPIKELEKGYRDAFDSGEIFEQVDATEIEANQASIVVAFVGAVSAGKSSLIKALFGFAPGDISPIEGSTAMVKYFQHPSVENFYVADTPGLADVEAWRSDETYDAMPNIDVVIFVLDKLDDRAIQEQQRIEEAWQKPCLVVRNKMDDIAEQRRPEMLEHVSKHFPGSKVIGCAAGGEPPDTARIIEPFGLSQITDWIWDLDLSEAKKMRFITGLKDKETAANKVINYATSAASAVGLLPVPGADIIPIALIQVGMVRKINTIYQAPAPDDALSYFINKIVSVVARRAYRFAIQFGKGLGWFAGPWGPAAISAVASIIAGAATYALGQSALLMCKNNLWNEFNVNDEIATTVLKKAHEAYEEHANRQGK